ncbi:MAG: two pore domain potassium channel family protein [Candidatus Tectomicrobia bacterium]|nr:two pore domain potassium channel family protein [Candidatus Tectomicrobia bacterium]
MSRWKIFLLYPLSLTLLLADFCKYFVGPNKTAIAQFVIKLNVWYLWVTFVATFIMFVLDYFVPLNIGGGYQSVVLFLLALYAFFRCNEIFFAFVCDATDHLRPNEHATDLKYYQRIKLAMRSYLELILAYGLVFRAISQFWGGFCPPLDIQSAVYLSGITIATIGYGDIYPTNLVARLMTIYEFLNGIALIVVSFTVYVSRSIAAKEFKKG